MSNRCLKIMAVLQNSFVQEIINLDSQEIFIFGCYFQKGKHTHYLGLHVVLYN